MDELTGLIICLRMESILSMLLPKTKWTGAMSARCCYTARTSESAVSRAAGFQLANLVMMWQSLHKRITSSHHSVTPGGIRNFLIPPGYTRTDALPELMPPLQHVSTVCTVYAGNIAFWARNLRL